ncbi:hypothetical protein C2857_003072 [Epichloe festucae Fl1]|uniref:gamma-glutamylcyclotransferase n=1 Tax=Epichloe festucae (strain Fl1) TaxID=877507 RepID=A0A7U3Q0A9_EPIFF|nr:hypothetical protein C2857_003072 [Epichloe festucae Fl1]
MTTTTTSTTTTTTSTSHNRNHDGSAWYFGYGANMAASVFIERRKIRPLRTEAAYIPSHALCFNVLGIPYLDPGNGGIRPLVDQEKETADPKACVHGVAYLLTPDHLKKVVLSEGCVAVPIHVPIHAPIHAPIHLSLGPPHEGVSHATSSRDQLLTKRNPVRSGGIAYNVVQLDAKLLQDGATIQVKTLIGRHNVDAESERLPSMRYISGSSVHLTKGVLTRGANEQNLPQWYQQKLARQATYQPRKGWWFQLGVSLFLWPWTRAGIMTERLVYKFQGPDGHVPAWFLFIFDFLLRLLWAQHDYINGPIFGRGDGR